MEPSSQPKTQQSEIEIVDVESERFVVCIHDRIEENNVAFRVSPDQTVLRVLKGACKHFKVDFARSALYMVMSLDGVQKRVKRQHSATMKSLDVQEFQEFVVAPALAQWSFFLTQICTILLMRSTVDFSTS